jgi:serine/threonine protein phosphatase 1
VLNLLNWRPQRQRPSLASDHRFYVIGDVHGRVDLLDEVLYKIAVDRVAHPSKEHAVVCVGDYVDRGPNSREVIDRLIACVRSQRTVLLKGNHEAYVLHFLDNPSILSEWRLYGGLQTLVSYGLKPSLNPDPQEQRELARELKSVLPENHKALLEAMPATLVSGDFYFVHAGVRPGVPLNDQQEQDLLWIRDDFLCCEDDHGKIIVHGHTPVNEIDIRHNRINIDTGAYATGRLACLIIDGEDVEPLQI